MSETDLTAKKPSDPPPIDDGSVPPCDIHGGVQVRYFAHVGDGKTKLDAPICPYCVELSTGKPTA